MPEKEPDDSRQTDRQSGEFPADVVSQRRRPSPAAQAEGATLDKDEPTLPGTPLTLLLARGDEQAEAAEPDDKPQSGFISAVNPTKRLRQMFRAKLAKTGR